MSLFRVPRLPHGGASGAGDGRDLGMAALEGYTELKNVYVAD